MGRICDGCYEELSFAVRAVSRVFDRPDKRLCYECEVKRMRGEALPSDQARNRSQNQVISRRSQQIVTFTCDVHNGEIQGPPAISCRAHNYDVCTACRTSETNCPRCVPVYTRSSSGSGQYAQQTYTQQYVRQTGAAQPTRSTTTNEFSFGMGIAGSRLAGLVPIAPSVSWKRTKTKEPAVEQHLRFE